MRRALRNGLIWIIAGIMVVVAAQILLVRNENDGRNIALEKEAARVKSVIQASLKAIHENKAGIIMGDVSLDIDAPGIRKLTDQGVDVFVFKSNVPTFWTTRAFNVFPRGSTGFAIQKHASRYVMAWSVFMDTAEYIFTREIIKNPEFHFVSAGAMETDASNKYAIVQNPVIPSAGVDVDGIGDFYIVLENYVPGIGFDLMLIGGLLCISLGIILIFRKTGNWPWMYIFNFILWLGTEYLFLKNITLGNLKTLPLFAPDIYASSTYFPNLGVMMFNLLMAFLIWLFVQQIIKKNMATSSGFNRFIARLVLTVLLVISTAFLIAEAGKLVRDSSIVFDFYEIHLISIYTLLGVLGLALGFATLFSMIKTIEWLRTPKYNAWWFFFVSLPAIGVAAYYFWRQEQELLAYLLSMFLLIFLSYRMWLKQWRPWFHFALMLLIPTVVVGIVFNHEVDKKEIELRRIQAENLLLQSEREPGNLLQKTEVQLQKDKGVVDYYTCLDETKSDFDKRLRQYYFADYAEEFEILIFDYNALGRGYREEHPFSFYELNTLYTSNAVKPVTKSFALVNERKLKGSFLGRFPVATDTNGLLGVYFVLLKPRLSASQGRFPDVFHKSPIEALFVDNQYSYAFYSNNNKLSRRYGQYNYPNVYLLNKDQNPVSDGGFSHYSYSDDLGNFIVISKPEKKWLQGLTVFTILALGCLILGALYMGFIFLWQYIISFGKQNFSRLRLMQLLKQQIPGRGASDLFLSSKLQLYVILVVSFTFILVILAAINHIKSTYSQRQRESLWNKTNEIANTIGSQANLDALFNRYQTGLVYDLSNYYSTDINIYNATGRLIVSSNEKIYDLDLLGSMMNPRAYRDFTKQGISGFTREEKVGDLKYISAYYTIFDNDLNVKGYLNLPYFTNRQDLYREISNYASTIINLFALIFALTALIAYVIAHRITEPLNLIRHQMALVKLGAKNAPIAWQHNDEIGLLIVEYNRMINALEESSNRLAESEREGAWREMAKQVAHEIKNPLTPMKLSLQHLQFALQKKDENVEEKMKKTIDLLINQIDSLSRMAEEFSAFAKMPDAKTERVLLNSILDQVVNLFSKEDGCTFHYTPLEKAVFVNADPHQLNRVFTNIIKNGIQAIPEDRKGLLRIHGEVSHGKVKIFFEDNGKGIPVDLQHRIFSPNFSTKNSGMGLGLAISRKIMEQFSGEIDFQSKGEKGTIFYVVLPVLEY